MFKKKYLKYKKKYLDLKQNGGEDKNFIVLSAHAEIIDDNVKIPKRTYFIYLVKHGKKLLDHNKDEIFNKYKYLKEQYDKTELEIDKKFFSLGLLLFIFSEYKKKFIKYYKKSIYYVRGINVKIGDKEGYIIVNNYDDTRKKYIYKILKLRKDSKSIALLSEDEKKNYNKSIALGIVEFSDKQYIIKKYLKWKVEKENLLKNLKNKPSKKEINYYNYLNKLFILDEIEEEYNINDFTVINDSLEKIKFKDDIKRIDIEDKFLEKFIKNKHFRVNGYQDFLNFWNKTFYKISYPKEEICNLEFDLLPMFIDDKFIEDIRNNIYKSFFNVGFIELNQYLKNDTKEMFDLKELFDKTKKIKQKYKNKTLAENITNEIFNKKIIDSLKFLDGESEIFELETLKKYFKNGESIQDRFSKVMVYIYLRSLRFSPELQEDYKLAIKAILKEKKDTTWDKFRSKSLKNMVKHKLIKKNNIYLFSTCLYCLNDELLNCKTPNTKFYFKGKNYDEKDNFHKFLKEIGIWDVLSKDKTKLLKWW